MKLIAHQVPGSHPKPEDSVPLEQEQSRWYPGLIPPPTAFYNSQSGSLTSEMGVAGRKGLGGIAMTPGHK